MYKKSEKLKIIRAQLERGSQLLAAVKHAEIRSPYTLTLWRKRPLIDRYIRACIARCESKRIEIAEDALFKAAAEGNITALIFFLTNRCPERWADKRALVNNTIINQNKNGNITAEDRKLSETMRNYLRESLNRNNGNSL